MAPVDMGGDLSGRLLGGRYRVTGRLGRGGMGVVCRTVDAVLGREVAVKVLRPIPTPPVPSWPICAPGCSGRRGRRPGSGTPG
ncbi:hypothetical protein GCM10009680_29780 [Streptomyces yatensis]|uniref:Protein kinase domain-containing protein n=1 Tax=Streptomyces yatensis TaxID=155177 RepID=A0ABP4THS3_9ACTN